MDTELKQFIEAQEKFQKAVLQNITLLTKNIQALDERIKVCHERCDLQGKQIDTLLEIIVKLQNKVHILQEWKINKEGI